MVETCTGDGSPCHGGGGEIGRQCRGDAEWPNSLLENNSLKAAKQGLTETQWRDIVGHNKGDTKCRRNSFHTT